MTGVVAEIVITPSSTGVSDEPVPVDFTQHVEPDEVAVEPEAMVDAEPTTDARPTALSAAAAATCTTPTKG